MTALQWRRLPASPVEHSRGGRVLVFAGFAVAALAIALYGQSYVVPVIGVAVAAIGHVVSYRERSRKRGTWRQVLLAGLILAALFYLMADSVFALFGGVLPQANFAILLVAITSFDLKTRRNCYSSLLISLAILYLAAVYAWDYAFGVLAALWVACLAGFWMASHLRAMDARLGGPPAIAVNLLAALVAGVVLFVVVPQPSGLAIGPLIVSLPSFTVFKGELENPALPLIQLSGDQSGTTTSIDLHYRGRLGDAPVMYVRTSVPAYWRGLVFDTYRDGAWTAADHTYQSTPSYVLARELPPAPPGSLGTFVQQFRVVRQLPGILSAAYPVQSLYAPFSGLREDAYGTFHTPEALSPGQTYSVVSYLPNLSAEVLRSDELPSTVPGDDAAYLDAGGLSAPARELAAQVTSGATNEYDLVMALTTYLQHGYRYSLDLSPVPAGRDPVDWFLFDVKTGYCEQFATAEALMLRSLGIPARLVTGYAPGDYSPVLDQSVVRERDAHAWVEVWFSHEGWVPVDPTPGVAPVAAAAFSDHWAAGGLGRLIPHLQVEAPVAALGSLGALAAIPAVLACGVLAALALLWVRRRPRGRRVQPAPGESELLRLYDRLQRRAGRRRAPPETPLEYLQGIGPNPVAPLLGEVTEAVNSGAYAGRWPSRRKVRELAERLS